MPSISNAFVEENTDVIITAKSQFKYTATGTADNGS